MTKPVLAVDIDEVILPLVGDFIRHQNEKYGRDFTIGPGFEYFGTHHMYGVPKEQLLADLDEYYETEHHDRLLPIDGAIESLGRLERTHAIVLMTSRTPESRQATERWLKRHFPSVMDRAHFLGFAGHGMGGKPKIEQIRELDAIGLVDDHIGHVAEVAADGRLGILFGDYHWNQIDTLPEGVIRAKDWLQVEELLR